MTPTFNHFWIRRTKAPVPDAVLEEDAHADELTALCESKGSVTGCLLN